VNLEGKRVMLHDMSLRDGMHPQRHQLTAEQMIEVATALDAAGVPLIEVTHGDGLGGASVNYGFPAATDEEYLRAVVPKMQDAKVSALLIPGIGTVDHLRMAHDCGVHTIRVATHCTEADVSEQHIGLGAKMEMDTVGFLMMAHMIQPEELLEQAKLMQGYGANCIYVTDSAGHIHGHHNLHLGIANSLAAVEAGAARIDGSVAGMGAGAGNTPLEVFVAVLHRMGVETEIDMWKLMDVAEDIVYPLMTHKVRADRDSLTLGYAGVYSSFLLHAKRAADKYGLKSTDILIELGRMKTVGGQEDMIEDVALDMKKAGAVEWSGE